MTGVWGVGVGAGVGVPSSAKDPRIDDRAEHQIPLVSRGVLRADMIATWLSYRF